MRADLNIPHKASRVLNLVLLAFLLIFLRAGYLSVYQIDYHRKEARKPQRRSVLEKVERATIRDRFNLPLAQNSIQYSAAIRYADIRELPSFQWQVEENGCKKKKPVRSLYITRLSQKLASELGLEAQDVEDIIYAKASLFPHTPFVIKEGISEGQYYRLRAMQKDWVGVEAVRGSQRVYPYGKAACDVIGYMGAISSQEYLDIAEEIQTLETYIQKRENGEIVFLPQGHENPFSVRKRLQALKEKAYTINDCVGKAGIESVCDEILRGSHGKKWVEIDPRGNTIRELPGSRKGISGERVLLSISVELQEFAEALLAQNEQIRDQKDSKGDSVPGVPWIKGGAIVAMDPLSGEILALASCPRVDPNDFVREPNVFTKRDKKASIRRWIESSSHMADLWDGRACFSRETYDAKVGFGEEHLPLTWTCFLRTIVSPSSSVWKGLARVNTLQRAYQLHSHFRFLWSACDQVSSGALLQVLFSSSYSATIDEDLRAFIEKKLDTQQETLAESIAFIRSCLADVSCVEDQLLVLDLTHLLMQEEVWDPSVVEAIGHLSLEEFFSLSQSFAMIQAMHKDKMRVAHHKIGFMSWRDKWFKKFLSFKRKEEKEKKTYARPYTEYLEKVENSLFNKFWNSCKYLFLDTALYGARVPVGDYPELVEYLEECLYTPPPFLLPHIHKLQAAFATLTPPQVRNCFQAMRSFEELNRPLYGKYRLVRSAKGEQLEKHLASSFYPLSGFGYGRSFAFRQSTPQGSIFKLVVAYEALKERYEYLKENLFSLHDLNPLTLIDQLRYDTKPGSGKQILGYTIDGQPIRRFYKGGVIPRSSHGGIGRVGLVEAIEQSSNLYFALLAAEHIADPSLLVQASYDFGFGAKSGLDLPGEIGGNIPHDLSDNKTGLYSFAIGQHSLVGTPLQAAMMLSAIGAHGHVMQPHVVKMTAGKSKQEGIFHVGKQFPFQYPLSLVGIQFPLFTESLGDLYHASVDTHAPKPLREIFLPEEIREVLLEGMHKVVTGSKGTARPTIIRHLRGKLREYQNYVDLAGEMVGKTGTAEIWYKPWIDKEAKGSIHNHIWFGGLVFPEGDKQREHMPELAVVVYLRFSEAGGKEAAPLAAAIAKKWREIQARHRP